MPAPHMLFFCLFFIFFKAVDGSFIAESYCNMDCEPSSFAQTKLICWRGCGSAFFFDLYNTGCGGPGCGIAGDQCNLNYESNHP